MTIEELYNRLKELRVSEDRFYLHGLFGSTDDNDKLALSIKMGKYTAEYEVYYKERVNRTLKHEYGLKQTIKDTELAQKMTQQAVYIYNNLRTHFSLDLRKPAEVHLNPNIKYRSYRKNNLNLAELRL